MNRSIALINATIRHGQPHKGVEKAPQFLKNMGLYGSLYYHFDSVQNYFIRDNVNFSYEDLYKVTQTALQKNTFSLILGGDHSLSLGTVPAIFQKYPDVKVIWIDAHGDLNTPETSPSGQLHGMPLAALTGQFNISQVNPTFHWLTQFVPAKNIYLLGVRDLDRGEIEVLKSSEMNVYSYEEIKSQGIHKVLAEIKETIGHAPTHLSFDIDALDPKIAPSTGVPVAGGLNLQQTMVMAQELGGLNLVSLEVLEFNPEIDNSVASAEATAQIIKSFINTLFGKLFHRDNSAIKDEPGLHLNPAINL